MSSSFEKRKVRNTFSMMKCLKRKAEEIELSVKTNGRKMLNVKKTNLQKLEPRTRARKMPETRVAGSSILMSILASDVKC